MRKKKNEKLKRLVDGLAFVTFEKAMTETASKEGILDEKQKKYFAYYKGLSLKERKKIFDGFVDKHQGITWTTSFGDIDVSTTRIKDKEVDGS